MDAEFWVAVAFVAFVGVLYRAGAFTTLVKGIDARSDAIRHELEEAKALRAEAQRVLHDYQKKFKDAEGDAEKIIAQARAEAARYAADVEAEFKDFMARRRLMAEQRIAQAEAQAVADIRGTAADLAIKASEIVLRSELKGPKGDELIASGLKDLGAKLN